MAQLDEIGGLQSWVKKMKLKERKKFKN
jgi:hypothetical protein